MKKHITPYLVPVFVLAFAISAAAYNHSSNKSEKVDSNKPYIRNLSGIPAVKKPVNHIEKQFKTGDYIFSYSVEGGSTTKTMDYYFGGFQNEKFFSIYPLVSSENIGNIQQSNYNFYAKKNKIINLPYSDIKLRIVSYNLETDSIAFQILK
ncbi:hypothetical protein [Priestia megaterium]|uniref:hypothetical protein n=1 Tax=Priestia megaterium TaxID=1404 RepID=UPI003101721F